MNPDTPQTPREEIEIRITAMLMGELSSEETAALQNQIAADPELSALHARLRQAIALLREASAISEPPAPPVQAQLSSERREKLLAHFKAPAPAPAAVIVKPQREWRKYVPLGLAASLIALLGGSIFLSAFGGRSANRALLSSREPEAPASELPQALSASRGYSQTEGRRGGARLSDGTVSEGIYWDESAPDSLSAFGGGKSGAREGNGVRSEESVVNASEMRPADMSGAQSELGILLAKVPTPKPAAASSRPQIYLGSEPKPTSAPSFEMAAINDPSVADGFKSQAGIILNPAAPSRPSTASRGRIDQTSGGVTRDFGDISQLSESDSQKRGALYFRSQIHPAAPLGATAGDRGESVALGEIDRLDRASEASGQLGVADAFSPPEIPQSFGGRRSTAFPVTPATPNTLDTLSAMPAPETSRLASDTITLPALPSDNAWFGNTAESDRAPLEELSPAPPVEYFVRRSEVQSNLAPEAPIVSNAVTGKEMLSKSKIALPKPAPAQSGSKAQARHLHDDEVATENGLWRMRTRQEKMASDAEVGSEFVVLEEPALEKSLTEVPEVEAVTGDHRGLAPQPNSESRERAKIAATTRLLSGVVEDRKDDAAKREQAPPQSAPVKIAALSFAKKPVADKDSDEKPAAAKPAEPAPEPQPEIATIANAFSTFSLNVTDVAFKLAAASLEQGKMPELSTVRSEEFINAFDYHDPEPAAGAPLAFATERARYPFAQNRDLVRFAVKTAAAGRQPGRALNLVLLLDNSGSMERADRVRILHEALRVLSAQLQPQDKLSVVTFSRTPRLWADGVAGDKAAEVTSRVGEITPQGGTNLDAALDLGYATALKHFKAGSVNRVVLLTDGAANLGDVNPDALKQKVEAHRKQGVALDCFGIGWEGYDDTVLEALSRNGDGRYGFINTPEQAATEFAGQLAGALRVAASDVKVQVEWNPRRVTSYRQIGYAKHQLKKEQFRDNTVDAAEIGAAESGNALYTVEVNPRGEGDLATVRVRFKVPGTSDYKEHEWTVPYTKDAPPLEQTSPALRLAGTASAFSEWLVSSQYATEVTPDRLLSLLNGVPETYRADPRPRKLEWMIRQAKSVSGR